MHGGGIWWGNQGRTQILSRQHDLNESKRARRLSTTAIIVVALLFWALIWIGGVLVFATSSADGLITFLGRYMRPTSSSPGVTSGSQSQIINSRLRGGGLADGSLTARAKPCWFLGESWGYLKRGTPEDGATPPFAFESLALAQAKCLAEASCRGVTMVPWIRNKEERFELRFSSEPIVETFDGQRTHRITCQGDKEWEERGSAP